jgi:hypothetical protein
MAKAKTKTPAPRAAIPTELVETFGGVTALAQHLIAAHRVSGSGNSAEAASASMDWDLNMGWYNALALASQGGQWDDGAAALQSARVEIDRMRTSAPALERVRSVAGYMPDVPSFLAGLPQAMWTDAEPEDAPRARAKVLRVGVAATYSASATSEHVMNRGAAIMSCVDALESEGFRVEVCAVIIAADDCYDEAFRWDVVIKQADQDWTPGAVAFALAHPAFNRRLAFGLKERCAKAFRNTNGGGYNGGRANDIDGSDYDLWLPRLCMHNMQPFAKRETSAAAVVELLKSAGVAA